MRCFLKRFSSWSYFLPLVFLSFLLLTILNTNSVFADSYTYTFDSSNVSSNLSTQYLWVDDTQSYPNSNLPAFTNPFSFVPRYIQIDFNSVPSNSSFGASVSLIRYAIATNSSLLFYNSNLLNTFRYFSSRSFSFSLDNIIVPSGLSASSTGLNGDTLGGSFLALANFSNSSGSGNPTSFFNNGGSISITFYDSVPSGGITPSGSITLSSNGTYDVSYYAEAVVDVPPIMGDYHDDLVDIKRSIYVGSATLLVIYFFYCIYRMIIKGVKK